MQTMCHNKSNPRHLFVRVNAANVRHETALVRRRVRASIVLALEWLVQRVLAHVSRQVAARCARMSAFWPRAGEWLRGDETRDVASKRHKDRQRMSAREHNS